MTCPLSGIKGIYHDQNEYDRLMTAFPLLKTCNGEALPDREHAQAAFFCAGHAYMSNLIKVAANLIRSILNTFDVPDEIVCATAIFDAQIALEANHLGYAAEVVRRIVTLPQWVNAGEDLRNIFAILSTRINIRKEPNTKCPELNGKKSEDIHWLSLKLESGLRDGTFLTVLKPLLELRKKCTEKTKIDIEMTIAELYFRGYENLDIAEDYYLNSLDYCQKLNDPKFIKLNYDVGTLFLCNNKPFCSFYSLLIGLPSIAHNPESWMRIAQASILCVNQKNIFQRETIQEIESIKKSYDVFYSDETNRKIANDVVKEEMFKKEYYNGHLQNKPEPSYKFAFNCIQKACKLVQEKPRVWIFIHFDLMSMYIFLSIELNMIDKAFESLNASIKIANTNVSHRNVCAIFKAKLLILANKPGEAIESLNSITYPNDGRKPRVNKGRGYLQHHESTLTESCFDNAFSFLTMESMRLKFLFNVQKTRNDVREYLEGKKLTNDLRHSSDKESLF